MRSIPTITLVSLSLLALAAPAAWLATHRPSPTPPGPRTPASEASGNACVARLKSSYSERRRQLVEYTERLARAIPPEHGFLELARPVGGKPSQFCSDPKPTKFIDLWHRTRDLAERHLSHREGRYDGLVEGLAAAVRSCGYSQAAFRNAAFTLDCLYMVRMTDLTGHEVADVLLVRDAFYDAYLTGMTTDTAQRQLDFKPSSPPAPGQTDFLNAPPLGIAAALKAFGKAVNATSPSQRKAVDGISDLLGLRKGSLVLFGNELMKVLEDPRDLRFMHEAYAYLMRLQANPRLLGRAHAGWEKLMELSDNDPARIFRVMGILTTVRFWQLDEVGSALARRGQLGCDALQAMYEGSMTYFLLNQLDERAALDSPDGHSVEYHFFYPRGFQTKNWKAYHWYSNGYIGCEMVKRGYSREQALYGVRSLAQAYEFFELNMPYPARLGFGVDTGAQFLLEGWKDVELNVAGGKDGSERCKP